MTKRRVIQRRTRIFLGCEGESERGYGAFLQRLADRSGAFVHIKTAILQPAGDPLQLAQRAVRALDQEIKKGGSFGHQAVLFDTDKLADVPDKGREARAILARRDFIAIWQRPDHEGFLLRHFAGHERDDPPPGKTMLPLAAVWPTYHKNMSAAELEAGLTLDHILRASRVEPDLRALIEFIGLSDG